MTRDQQTPAAAPVQSVLCIHTCWGLAHAEWVTITSRRQADDGAVHYSGVRCDGTEITLIEAREGCRDLEIGWSNPCSCWEVPAAGHAGHCCFVDDFCLEHDELVRARVERRPVGDIPMYPTDDAARW